MGRTGSYREYTGVGDYSDIFLTSHAQSIRKSCQLSLQSISQIHLGLPWWHSGKESACQCRRLKRCRLNPWVLGEGNGKLLQSSCLKNSTDRGAWLAAIHGVTKSQTLLSDTAYVHLTLPHSRVKTWSKFHTEMKSRTFRHLSWYLWELGKM